MFSLDVMISHFDDLDLEVNNLILKRTSSAEGLTRALQAAISSYDEIVSIASVLVEPSEPPPSTDVIVSSL